LAKQGDKPVEQTETLIRGEAASPGPIPAVVRTLGQSGELRLGHGVAVVGSGPACDLVVTDTTVSRMHAELSLVPEGVAVRDLGSRNGTFYLGQRVEKLVLRLGARVQLGAATLAIEPDRGALGEGPTFDGDVYRGIVGASPSMRRIFAVLTRLEGSLATVLVEGESGVGKEEIARALHEGSPASRGPMVPVNCGALPRELVGSELFGHKKGAFTGATDNRKGAFESADGGTLFLDEIGELPLDVQPMLLRVLESSEVRPIGDEKAKHVRVRIVAATNRDLEREVREGRFREDLYYRLAVVRLIVPPLRARPEDIEPLARRFAEAFALGELPSDVIERLRARAWPGNARELRNAVQAWGALGVFPEGGRSMAGALELALREIVDPTQPLAGQREAVADRFTALYLEALLKRTKGNQSAAAKIADMDRGYLGKLLAKHGIKVGG
jgi:transcriptional regulator with GAF, ATPase, and Fis domain